MTGYEVTVLLYFAPLLQSRSVSPPLSALSPVQPLHTQIRDLLRARILDGTYQPHDKLPSEKELMDRFGVSRITVRHALSTLETEGMVFKIPGKGAFVSKPKPAQELARLQGFAEAMGGKGYQTCNRVEGIRSLPASAAVATAFALEPGTPVVEIRRVRYLDQLPVSFDTTYVTAAIGQRLAKEDLVTRDIYLILENDYGIAPGYADLNISAVVADEEVAARLDVRPGDPLLYLERMTYTQDGQPLELDYIHYRGDRFRYQLRIDRG